MNTRHVPSLELSQEFDRLCNEKGIVVPMTEYIWVQNDEGEAWFLVANFELKGTGSQVWLNAPLVSELGEWLPAVIELGSDIGTFSCWKRSDYSPNKEWGCSYQNSDERAIYYKNDDTEASARQLMLNQLITEGIVTTPCQPT